MSNGATAQDKLYSSTNDPVVGGSSSPAPMLEVVDVEAGKKGVPVILPAPVYNSPTGHVYELPADTITAVDSYCLIFSVPILNYYFANPIESFRFWSNRKKKYPWRKSKQASCAKSCVDRWCLGYLFLLLVPFSG